jgi:hypothetical protein
MTVEMMFLPIMAGATRVQRERERERERERAKLPYLCLYSGCVLYNIHTQSRPDVSGLRHCNTCRLTLVTRRLPEFAGSIPTEAVGFFPM